MNIVSVVNVNLDKVLLQYKILIIINIITNKILLLVKMWAKMLALWVSIMKIWKVQILLL